MARRWEGRAAYWRGVLADWKASGLTASEFSRRRKICRPLLFAWRRRSPSRLVETGHLRLTRLQALPPSVTRQGGGAERLPYFEGTDQAESAYAPQRSIGV